MDKIWTNKNTPIIYKSRRKTTMTIAAMAALSLSIQFMSVAAASSPSATASAQSAAAISGTTSTKTINAFEAYLAKGQLPAAISYLKAHIDEVATSQATVMVLHLENALKKQLTAIQKRFEQSSVQTGIGKAYKRGATFDYVISRTKDSKLKALLKETRDSGYKLETAEGFFYPVIDYAAFRTYSASVNPDIDDYIAIMAVESDQTKVKDAALVIGYQQLVNRALAQERFLAKYPYSNRAPHIRNLFRSYELLTFYGVNNTPLFEYGSQKIQPNALRGYNGMLTWNNAKLSPYLTKLQEFMDLVANNENMLTEEVEKYRQSHYPTR
jgi:hypothetical protein